MLFRSRIDAAMGHPERDPHGDPIPSANLSLPVDSSLPLSSLRPDTQAVILRVLDEDSAFLRHLDERGLVPGAQISISEFSSFDNNLTITVKGGLTSVLGPAVTSKIFVEVS